MAHIDFEGLRKELKNKNQSAFILGYTGMKYTHNGSNCVQYILCKFHYDHQ
jgi:hypothetical protein